VVAAWPTTSGRLSLGRRLVWVAMLALLGWTVEALRFPLDLWRAPEGPAGVVLPRGELEMHTLLPVAADRCGLDDLASSLARRWRLHTWRTPSSLTLVDGDGFVLSQWGDLSPAAENTRVIKRWSLRGPVEGQIELRVATGAWALLGDWRTGEALEATWSQRVWYVAMTRAGRVEATLHSQVRGLDAETAGALYHAGRGWSRMRVQDSPSLARVWRDGDWLVAAVAVSPTIPAWAVRIAMAALWALAGLAVARLPGLSRGQLGTFGGRLRLLIAGAVVLPLVVVTALLHSRLQREGERLDQATGLDALRAARYTADHLAGGFEVDDELARWLSGVGGEVVLFDGAHTVATSRPDLLAQGLLPSLPPAQAFTAFRLGRDEPVVQRRGNQLAGAGVVEVEGRRLLLELFPTGEGRAVESPDAVDWLLSGAALAALGALVLTSRVERRLSASLRELVDLARKLHHGEPVGEVPQPRERDLAEVLNAVRTMNQEVQQREIRLRHQEELLRLTLATLSPAVVVLDPTGEVRFANPSADTLIEEWQGSVPEPVLEVVRRQPEGETPLVETLRPRPGRDETWRVGVVGVPLPDGGSGLVAVVDDVTDLVRADRLRQLNQLARIVAHEVKNPLTPIRLWVQELVEARRASDSRLEELLDEACSEISTQVQRLQATASSFSNLVALERWEPRALDVGELVESAVAGLSVLERRGIRLAVQAPDPGAAKVMGDPQWLRRALRNLIQNSLDALAGTPGEIRLAASTTDESVVFEIEDTAGGIPETELNDIFGPHFSTTSSGSGLGLALVLQVVTRCDGRVAAANGERGLRVTIQLPRVVDR
jgi:signal transduction histidine kinase/HAMP domain-containing protein